MSVKVLSRELVLEPLDRLKPHPENPNRGDVGTIASSIRENGFYNVIVAQKSTGFILVGEHRWRALQEEDPEASVPVVWLDVDEERARRIMLVDNRSAELAERDLALLASILEPLQETGEGLEGTGYAPEDLADILFELRPQFQEKDEAPRLDKLDDPPATKCPECGHEW